MRNEKEVLNQLLTFAENNSMVRAVLLNGSRVNPNIDNDIFSDYDVKFAVTDPEYFLNNQEWIKYIGMNHNWEINTGTVGRWFEELLPNELWESYKKIYVGSNYEEIWSSLMEAGNLARILGLEIANQLEYTYPIEDDELKDIEKLWDSMEE